MAARMKGFLPLALVIGVLAFLYVEFALNFSFHWVTDGDLGNGLELPKNFHLVVPAAFVAWGMFFAAGGDNAAFTKVGIANVFGCVAAFIMIVLASAIADLPDFWGISLWVGVMAALLVVLAALGDWYFIPATFGAFASVVFWWLATGADGWAEDGGGVGNSVEALGDPATAGLGAFGGVLSTPYELGRHQHPRHADDRRRARRRLREARRRDHPQGEDERRGRRSPRLPEMAEISVTVEEAGHAYLNLTGLPKVEIRDSVELSGLEQTETVPALESIVLQFDHYGRLAGIEVAESALPPGLLDGA